jgi:hypothetical protein
MMCTRSYEHEAKVYERIKLIIYVVVVKTCVNDFFLKFSNSLTVHTSVGVVGENSHMFTPL